MLTAALTALCFTLALGLAIVLVRRRAAIDFAVRDWRIAMDFIAEEQIALPHEFAAIFVAGNRQAMERKFPEFFAFRQRCLEADGDWYE